MKVRAAISFILALTFVLALAAPGALASEAIYINGTAQPGTLDGLWAIGSGGRGQLSGGGQYVMTADGLVQLGGEPGLVEPEGDPEPLEVTGRLDLEYDKVRVALYYYDGESSVRNSTLEYANLENEVGSGYSLGYYDDDREFHALAYTDETAITMVMDRNTETPGGTVGCYHVLLPGYYDSFEEALEVAGAYSGGFVGYYDGDFRALYGNYYSANEAANAAYSSGGEAYTASSRCVVVTRTSDARILFEFDCGDDYSLAVEPRSTRGDALTWFKGYTYRGGFEYSRQTGGKLTVINVVDIEDYVKGVLPYEMSDGWPAEALKAQAMCARTYVASHFDSLPGYNCDVTNDTYSQVYRGTNASSGSTDAAVEATAGLYITSGGRPIDAMYCSSNGGATENSENVMANAVSYLRGKIDPYEAAAGNVNSYSEWTRTLTGSQLASAVNQQGYALSEVTDIELKRSETGNVIGITLSDPDGRRASFERGSCYSFVTGSLGLNSIRFELSENGSRFTFTGSGWGHSLGMSQYGAYAMAKSYGFTFDQIINFYFTGVELSRGV